MEMSEQPSQHQPEWFRAADGRARLFVLKPFYFQKEGVTLPGNPRKFETGEHLLDPKDWRDAAVLAHPWICEQFADGDIESPAKTRARFEAVVARDEEREQRQRALLRETEMHNARMCAAMKSQHQAQGQTGADLQSELDTPLNQPRAGGRQAAASDLDTPLNR
jgi:hypothetical protein